MKQSDLPLTITGLLIIALALGIWAISDAAHAEGNWCAEWAEGYAAGFCLHTRQCSIAPKDCPAPEGGEVDGYMRGLRDGLQDRRATI